MKSTHPGDAICRQPGALLADGGSVIVCDLANSKIRKISLADGGSGSAEVLVDKMSVDMPVWNQYFIREGIKAFSSKRGLLILARVI